MLTLLATKYVLPFLTSKVGMIAMIVGALFTWHHFDKSSAVRLAVVEYVAGVELDAERALTAAQVAKNSELIRRASIVKSANEDLQAEIDRSNIAYADLAQEIRDYEESLREGPVEPIDSDLFTGLRNN